MKLCVDCKYLNAKYWRGPICLRATKPIPPDPYTGTKMIRISYIRDERTEGECGPDAKFFKERFWTERRQETVSGIAGSICILLVAAAIIAALVEKL